MDLIGRSIADAVSQNLVGPVRRHSALAKKIPTVPLRKLLANRHIRDGNLNALFGNLAEQYGPVFRIRPPMSEPMIFLAGLETNQWVHKHGRMYLRTRDYFSDFEGVYGAAGVLPALDGADHFRLRKFLSPAYSRTRLAGQMDKLYDKGRAYMASLAVGDSYRATSMCRALVNAQLSPLFIGVDTQDLMNDLMVYKERALSVHIAKAPARVHAEDSGYEAPGESLGHTDGTRVARQYARTTCDRPAEAGGRLPQPARERPAVSAGVEPAVRFFRSLDCQRVPWRYVQPHGLRHGVAARTYTPRSKPKRMPCSPTATPIRRTSPPPTST